MRHLILGALLASCSSPALDSEPVVLDGVSFRIPAGWSNRDLSTPGRAMKEWTPSDNERKESIAILRVDLRGVFEKGGIARLEQLLRQAQKGLPHGTFNAPKRFTTEHGFTGVKIEGDFQPPGCTRSYRRIHVVVADGPALVHVIYTAAEPEPEAMDIVLDNLSRQGA